MIYTLTVSPSLDYYHTLSQLQRGSVCRSSETVFRAGGKGVNVSRMLGVLGAENCAVCLTAGFVGAEIERRITEMGISARFIRVSDGCSRVNIKLRELSPCVETEINAPAAELPSVAAQELLELPSSLGADDMLVLSGSLPCGQPELYERMMRKAVCRCFLDCSGRALTLALPQRPYLVKPNLSELEEFCGEKLADLSITETADYAEKLRVAGAQRVLVSLAERGAVLITPQRRLYAAVPKKDAAVNSTGAGDSLLAGYVFAVSRGENEEEALRTACACGSAKAFSRDFPRLAEVSALAREISVTEI